MLLQSRFAAVPLRTTSPSFSSPATFLGSRPPLTTLRRSHGWVPAAGGPGRAATGGSRVPARTAGDRGTPDAQPQVLRKQGNEETRNSQESFCPPPGTEILPSFPSPTAAAPLPASKIAGIAPGPPEHSSSSMQWAREMRCCDSAASVVGSAEVPPPRQAGTQIHTDTQRINRDSCHLLAPYTYTELLPICPGIPHCSTSPLDSCSPVKCFWEADDAPTPAMGTWGWVNCLCPGSAPPALYEFGKDVESCAVQRNGGSCLQTSHVWMW